MSSYPKLYNLGHPSIGALFNGPVTVEEKIDGSQFSFGVTYEDVVFCRSKGAGINMDDPPALFKPAVTWVKENAHLLAPGWVYRGEAICKPKHNTLVYSRAPTAGFILFDVMVGPEDYVTYQNRVIIARQLGLEMAPVYFEGEITGLSDLSQFMNNEALLGGKIEGLVVKNRNQFGRDGKPLIGKYVSEDFKEVHNRDWKERHPSGKDFIQILAAQYLTEARWNKAVQYLRDGGVLTNTPKDIGPLIRRVQEDIKEECQEEIMRQLLDHFWKDIAKTSVKGLPEWYNNKLGEDA